MLEQPECAGRRTLPATWREGLRQFQHLQTLPLGYFQRTRGGQIIARIISDTDQVKTAVSAALASLLQTSWSSSSTS